jgi:DNA protecting protein DprA
MILPVCTPVSPAELEARLRLHRLPEIGPKRFTKLLEAFGSASKAIGAPASAWRSLGMPAASAEARRCPEVRDGASHAMRWLERPEHHLLMWDQPDYPALLAQIPDPPPLLFVAGDPLILEKPQLAMVGSRRASRPGMDTAAAFSRSLAGAGFVITSGLALGIDAAAHQAALDVGGLTVGVLGTGLENFYPQRNRRLWRRDDRVRQRGAFGVSTGCRANREQLPATQPHHQRFVPWRSGSRGERCQRLFDYRKAGSGTGARGLRDSRFDSSPRCARLSPVDSGRCSAGGNHRTHPRSVAWLAAFAVVHGFSESRSSVARPAPRRAAHQRRLGRQLRLGITESAGGPHRTGNGWPCGVRKRSLVGQDALGFTRKIGKLRETCLRRVFSWSTVGVCSKPHERFAPGR